MGVSVARSKVGSIDVTCSELHRGGVAPNSWSFCPARLLFGQLGEEMKKKRVVHYGDWLDEYLFCCQEEPI